MYTCLGGVHRRSPDTCLGGGIGLPVSRLSAQVFLYMLRMRTYSYREHIL